MVFSIDVEDDEVREWSRSGEGIGLEINDSYTPTIYVSAAEDQLAELYDRIDNDTKINRVGAVDRRSSLHDRDGTTVLRVDLKRPSEVDTLARDSDSPRTR